MEKHIFISDDGTELILPVTPGEYTIPGTRNTKVVDLAQGGELLKIGSERLGTINLEGLLLPAQQYPFVVRWTPQDACRAWLVRQRDEKRTLRYVITEKNFSVPCKLITAEFSERDGSGDIYATLVLHKYVPPADTTAWRDPTAMISVQREEPLVRKAEVTEHKVIRGDNLYNLCRKYYADGSLYPKVAAYNSIKNPNLISIGQVIKFPPRSELEE